MALKPLTPDLPPDEAERLRWDTFGHKRAHSLQGLADLLRFVKKRGFVLYRPKSGVQYPSVLEATCGRPLLDFRWDERALQLEVWKNDATRQGRLVLCGCFAAGRGLAATGSLADFCCIALDRHGIKSLVEIPKVQDGVMNAEAIRVCQALKSDGPLDFGVLGKQLGSDSLSAQTRLSQAVDEAVQGLWVVEVGSVLQADSTPQPVYDFLARRFPEVDQKAQALDLKKARQHIALRYMRNVIVEGSHVIAQVLGWDAADTLETLESLLKKKQLFRHKSSRHNRHIFQAAATDLL